MDTNANTPQPPNYIDIYINSLTTKEMKAYGIAKSHLGSTFDITKSIGFRQWHLRFIQEHNAPIITSKL